MRQYIYGRNVVFERLDNQKAIYEIFVVKGKHLDIVNLAKSQKVKVNFVSKAKLNSLVKGKHQDVIASVETFNYASLDDIKSEKEDALILMLDQIEDPHNFGAIIRTANAVGVDGIVILNRRQVGVNATVIKAAAGSVDKVKIAEVTNLTQTLKQLKAAGYWVVGTAFEDAIDYRSIDYKRKLVLVMGSEGSGISRLVLETCDFVAKIPMALDSNSLNVSVASGVMLYEIFNQRHKL